MLIDFFDRADKSAFQGIASDVVTEDLTDFSFKVHGHKHTFQAATKAERDAWLKAVETTVTEAKAAHENIVGSEGYKSELAKFSEYPVTWN